MNREEKQKLIDELHERFQKAKALVVTEYKGMTVANLSELRNALRGASVEYRVVKNTLARIASENTPVSSASEKFDGPVGLAIGYGDPIRAAKGVLEFSRKNDKLKVLGGVIDSRYYAMADLKAVAELPPKEVLLGMLAGAMAASTSRMAYALAQTVTRFAFALNSLKARKAG